VLYLFNPSGGFGMIAVDGGTEQAFLHHADLGPGLLGKLKQGDRLEFDTIQDAKGVRAVNVKRVLNLEEEITVTESDQVPGAGGAFKIRITKKKKKKNAPQKKKRKKK